MSLDTGFFVTEMARRPSVGSTERAYSELWPITYDIIRITLTPNEPMVFIGPRVMDVNALFITFTPLSRTREILLDIENENWRNAAADLPTSFIWHGEEDHLRLHPKPDEAYVLAMLIQRVPTDTHIPEWFKAVAALRATELALVGDIVTGRMQLLPLMQKWRGAYLAAAKQTLQNI